MCPKVTTTYKDEKVQSILHAAKTVFIQNGFVKTTMKHIVEAANISRGGLYLYFSSTEQLFEALMEIESQIAADSITSLMESNRSAKGLLTIFLEGEKAAINNITNTLIPAAYEFFIMRMRNGSPNDILTARKTRTVKMIAHLIRIGIERSEFQPDISAEKTAFYIVVFLEGLIATAISTGMDKMTVDNHFQFLESFLWD